MSFIGWLLLIVLVVGFSWLLIEAGEDADEQRKEAERRGHA